jgi:hypothetical protein
MMSFGKALKNQPGRAALPIRPRSPHRAYGAVDTFNGLARRVAVAWHKRSSRTPWLHWQMEEANTIADQLRIWLLSIQEQLQTAGTSHDTVKTTVFIEDWTPELLIAVVRTGHFASARPAPQDVHQAASGIGLLRPRVCHLLGRHSAGHHRWT